LLGCGRVLVGETVVAVAAVEPVVVLVARGGRQVGLSTVDGGGAVLLVGEPVQMGCLGLVGAGLRGGLVERVGGEPEPGRRRPNRNLLSGRRNRCGGSLVIRRVVDAPAYGGGPGDIPAQLGLG